jgi:hypothetical protein
MGSCNPEKKFRQISISIVMVVYPIKTFFVWILSPLPIEIVPLLLL